MSNVYVTLYKICRGVYRFYSGYWQNLGWASTHAEPPSRECQQPQPEVEEAAATMVVRLENELAERKADGDKPQVAL